MVGGGGGGGGRDVKLILDKRRGPKLGSETPIYSIAFA